MAIDGEGLDKAVDTLLEEPANQSDEDEEAEDEHHQVNRRSGHSERKEVIECQGNNVRLMK